MSGGPVESIGDRQRRLDGLLLGAIDLARLGAALDQMEAAGLIRSRDRRVVEEHARAALSAARLAVVRARCTPPARPENAGN